MRIINSHWPTPGGGADSPPSIVRPPVVATGAGSATATLPGVTPGNTLLVIFLQASSAIRTYTVADNVNGAWEPGPRAGTARRSGISYLTGAMGGDTQITVQSNGGSTGVTAVFFEITPADFDASDDHEVATNVTSHPCGTLNTVANVFVLSGGCLNASGGILTAAPGYERVDLGTENIMAQYRDSQSPLAGETGTWTSTTARQHLCISASFKAV